MVSTGRLDRRSAGTSQSPICIPDEDGAGVFWSIVHGLEALANYESCLLDAVSSYPTEFSLIMVNRLLNAGQTRVGAVSLVAVLQSVADNDVWPNTVRETASRFAGLHSKDA